MGAILCFVLLVMISFLRKFLKKQDTLFFGKTNTFPSFFAFLMARYAKVVVYLSTSRDHIFVA